VRIEFWIIIVASVFIIVLFLANKSKKKKISQLIEDHKSEIDTFKNDVADLINRLEDGQVLSDKKTRMMEDLRLEIVKQTEEADRKYNELFNKYNLLVRAYMVARKKDEIEVIKEIEDSISEDYEQLGSKTIPATTYIASAMADFYTSHIKYTETALSWKRQQSRSDKIADVRRDSAQLINRAKMMQYSYESALYRILKDHPEIEFEKYGTSLSEAANRYREENELIESQRINEIEKKYKQQFERDYSNSEQLKERIRELITENKKQESTLEQLSAELERTKAIDRRWPLLRDSILDYQKQFDSNLKAIPYMSRIIADIMTVDLDRLAWSLSWGNNQERKKKVQSIYALKKEKAEEIERIKGAEYQLAYLLELYPTLQDVIDTDFRELNISYDQIENNDPARRYMEREEWENLSVTERNQLALDRYIESRQKSKWQIGRDYELYCGYCYEQKGWKVDYYGSYNGLDDLGRDLIVKKNGEIKIIQCKYWARTKQIHEKHIMQLYGTIVEYNIVNHTEATGILITNTSLSDRAKAFAQVLGIEFKEDIPLGSFPRIKCNIGIGEFGEKTKIYHLPFDQQYDFTKIEKTGEFMALTVAEAERAGFRRAYRWHGCD